MSARGPSQAGRYDGPTYYEQPAVKASRYGALVWSYTWLAGLAGSAQVIATLAALVGRRDLQGVVAQGRRLAAWLPVAGAGLLIADLQTPQRFYNMLRIFRGTSPMSIGTTILSAFTATSVASAVAQAAGRPNLALAAQLPAAAAGAGMSVYTASLLSSTSTPLWSAEPRLLAGRFAASAFATGAASLALGECMRGHARNGRALQGVAVAAALAEHAFGHAAERAWRQHGVGDALDEPRVATARKAATAIGVLLPLACIAADGLSRRRSRTLTTVGALGVLAGGLAMRAWVFRAGNLSAQRPRDAFALTQGDESSATRNHEVHERG